MTNDRWQQLEELYNAAWKDRTVLDKADPELRREVESLLAQEKGAGFLESPALEVAAQQVAAEPGQDLILRRIGIYQILSLLGSGGMGEVYRAKDTKLKREVALKVLPDAFANDPERMARFQREAEVLAALNHPNIAQIYGVEDRALVMELVPGKTLKGPLPIDTALNYAKQIADALEAAHDKGITHRDLKPSNIMVTPEGVVKVLDFGLAAQSREHEEGETRITSPTRSGMIIGTAAYMSPEQARGETVDKRADIWAFGAVLYEMLTGKQAFSGETASDTLASVLKDEPEWSRVPQRAQRLVRRCLVKEPRNRMRDIGDARIAIEEVQSGAEIDGDFAQTPAGHRPRVLVGIVGVLFLTTILSLGALSVVYFNRTEPPEIRVEVSTPSTGDPFSFAISPDGRRLVFSASNEGKSQLWVRSLDSLTAQPLAGTEGASYPFWSPDSASVGFFADSKLKRIDIVGGAPQVLANAGAGRGGTWNRDGTILFAPNPAGPLLKLHASGEALAVTRLEAGQTAHKFPQFLPDGRHFIYFVEGRLGLGVYAGSLDGSSFKRLANTDGAAVVSPSGFLLFPRQTTLFGQAFDLNRQELSSNPFPAAEQVAFDAGIYAPGFSAASGIVAYRTGSAGLARQLTWLDRSGKTVGTIGDPVIAGLNGVELSPDEKRVAVHRTLNGNQDVWLIDAARGVSTRFTIDAADDFLPLWSPDGRRVVFASKRKGIQNLYWKLSSGAGADELLLETDQNKSPADWSSDGRFLLFRSNDPKTGVDLWVLPVSGDKKPFPFLNTPFDEREGQFSPDGKWIAYQQSNESGRFEVYVQPFPGPGGKFQISPSGGVQPRWNKNGKEIFYVSLDSKMMAAPVKLSPDGQSLEAGTPAALFPVRIAGGPVPGGNKQQYAVSSDGQRFLVNLTADASAAAPITLIYNWKPQTVK